MTYIWFAVLMRVLGTPKPCRHALPGPQWSLRTACRTHTSIAMQEEIYSSSYAAAAYLESVDFPKDKKVG